MEDYIGQWILLGFMIWLSWKVGQYTMLMGMRKLLESIARDQGISVEQLIERAQKSMDQERTGQPEPAKKEVWIDIEKLENQYFAYRQNGDFLAQGCDFAQLFQRMKTQYPDQDFRVPIKPEGLSKEEVDLMIESIFSVYGNAGPRLDK